MSSQTWEMQKENIVLFCFYNEPRWFLFVRLYWLAVWVMSENTREELSAVFELLTLWHCNQLSYLLISITGPIPLSLLNNKHECWLLGWRGGEGKAAKVCSTSTHRIYCSTPALLTSDIYTWACPALVTRINKSFMMKGWWVLCQFLVWDS